MRQSALFTKIAREAPKDAASGNAALLERGGFVAKNSAGVYSYLPLGWRVIKKIAAIIREEMDAIGGQEVLLPALVDRKYLEATGRDEVDIGFEVHARHDAAAPFILGWTHEDILTATVARMVSSYKDLPFAAYQIQTKFRNELRAKSGILRGREFIMKDLYSFHASEADFDAYYARAKGAYERVFSRCGLEAIYTVAGGGAFTARATHEFQVESSIGEDTVFVCDACRYAENSEVGTVKAGSSCPACGGSVKQISAIEVGNIFPLGTKYSEAAGCVFTDESGSRKPVIMGSYGIGVSRLMGTIAEIHRDERGLAWPRAVAPFAAHILDLTRSCGAPDSAGALIHDDLAARGIDALLDDRAVSPGEKLAGADVLGMPYRIVVSEKTGDRVELKERRAEEARLVSRAALYEI
jgi:prolyl-tRNA synthetase